MLGKSRCLRRKENQTTRWELVGKEEFLQEMLAQLCLEKQIRLSHLTHSSGEKEKCTRWVES
jgi:coenzyme F420-reducing hydrogenase delta subunit